MSSTLIGLIVALVHLGIIRMPLFGIANLLPALDPTELMREIFRYAARIVSVIAITMLTFVLFNALIDRVTLGRRMRGYVVLAVLIITTMMLIDLTNFCD
jgi:hypothetical protein